MTNRTHNKSAEKRSPRFVGSVWVIIDGNSGVTTLGSAMAFPTKEIAQSYCRFPGEFPFSLYPICKAKRTRTPNKGVSGPKAAAG